MLSGSSSEEDDTSDDDSEEDDGVSKSCGGRNNDNNNTTNSTDEENNHSEQDTIDIDDYDPITHIPVPPSPALTTLLDTGLYKAYQAELVPTVSAASQLLQLYVEMKEAAGLIVRECRWCVGVPLSGGLVVSSASKGSSG